MNPHRLSKVLVTALLTVAAGSSGARVGAAAGKPGEVSYVGETDSLPRLRFLDGQVSLNDRCPIRGGKLNRRVPAVYVNGLPIGFC